MAVLEISNLVRKINPILGLAPGATKSKVIRRIVASAADFVV